MFLYTTTENMTRHLKKYWMAEFEKLLAEMPTKEEWEEFDRKENAKRRNENEQGQ